MGITLDRQILILQKLMTIEMMKEIIFICILSSVCTLTHAQPTMKEKTFLDIKYLELSDKEKEQMLSAASGYTKAEWKGDYIYRLADGTVLFEMKGIATYLFETEAVFKDYIEASEKPQRIDHLLFGHSHPIKDTSFIEKRDMYIAFFAGEYGLEIDLTELAGLDEISRLLNQSDNEQIRKYRLSLIAIIGEFIVTNLSGAEWKYLNIPNSQKERVPVILAHEKTLINPATIFYQEYNKRATDKKYQINLREAVMAFIKD